jgi:hypothetical protein
LYNVLTKKNCIFNESCALHCWNLSALALLHSNKGMVMHYFQWSGVLAIRTMQCIPMLFLYNTLHLYYTPVGLLARLLILLPYIVPVCRLRWLLSSSLLTSSSSCTAAMLTDWIVFLFLLHAMPASCFILFLNWISNLALSFTRQLVLMHLFM